jgi:outer membrane protein TolC
VLTAFSEVDLALSNIGALAEQRTAHEIQIAAAREAYRIAQVRYRAGVDDLEAVLQAQSSLFNAEDSLSQIKLAQAEAAITLFRALGGGWQRPAPDAAP